MHAPRPFVIALVLGLSLFACKGSDSDPASTPEAKAGADEPAPAAPEAKTGSDPELATSMTEHFSHAAALEQVVIDGDLEAVGPHATWLVEELPKKQLPEPWRPFLDTMQSAAADAAKAESLAEAGAAAGKLIGTCGSCHRATGKGPKFDEPGPVPVGDETGPRMARHQWAAARMREGMVGPSERHWTLGAGAVSQAPPEPCPIPDAEVLPEETLKLREKIYELGAQALETKAPEARAQVYGEYLTTCAGCHVGGC